MDLARTDFYLDGQWVAAGPGETVEVRNPATEQEIGRAHV